MKLFLDVDGVLADFALGAAITNGWTKENWLNKLADIRATTCGASQDLSYCPEVLGLSLSEFWKPIKGNRQFWASLPKVDGADKLVSELDIACRLFNWNLFLCTRPSLDDPECYAGKIDWINAHYPTLTSRTILVVNKSLFANDQSVLIDDAEQNVTSFNAHGGLSYLYPTNENASWHKVKYKVNDTMEYLYELFVERSKDVPSDLF